MIKGKGAESKYIITRLFATDYFYYYSRPDLFAAYFFPFIGYGKNSAYQKDEFSEKITNIRANRHGNFYNYATQGFGNVAFYEPHITYDYFYSQLCQYDNEKIYYFDIQDTINTNLESAKMKEDLQYVLKKEDLFLKRKIAVLDNIKCELLDDLEEHENKYVLAKLLYYIVHSQHQLPDVEFEVQRSIIETAGFEFNFSTNVCMGFRKYMDEKPKVVCRRLQYASSLQLLCLDGISIFGDSNILGNDKGFYIELSKILLQRKDLPIEVILSEPNCVANTEECKYQVSINHMRRPKRTFSEYSIKKLLQLKNQLMDGQLSLKTTRLYLPYALFIVEFSNENLNYIKVDIYSPLLTENDERPSMYIFKKLDNKLYSHFKAVFENLWKNDECTQFRQG